MRKVTFEFESPLINQMKDAFLDKIHRVELLELLTWDPKRGIKIVLVEIEMKKGHTIEDLSLPNNGKLLDILHQRGSVYRCIMKAFVDEKDRYLAEKFDVNVTWTIPTIYTSESIVLSCMGEEDQLDKLLKNMQEFGKVRIVSFQKAEYRGLGVLSLLTPRQKEVLIAAKKNGYYDAPRTTNAENIAQGLGVSKATTVEHLRKAENRIINALLQGY